jgi:glycosyltransferase involved in cell wall biosynthesis
MKIVHLACVAPPQTGGIGQAALEEVRGLMELGHDACLLVPTAAGYEASPREVKRLTPRWIWGNASVLRRWEIEAQVKDADIVHLHYPFYGTDLLIADLRRKGFIKRLVLTLHMDAQAEGWKGMVFDTHRVLIQRGILKTADASIVSSFDYAENSSYASLTKDAEEKNRLHMHELPFGVDVERFKPGPPKHADFGIPEEAFVVGFVGGMDKAHAFKGVPTLLKALAKFGSHVWGVFAGEGDLRKEYERMAEILGIKQRVKFLGRVPDQKLPEVYRLFDVFAFPSTSAAEAFGLVALEAQACGIPVVASNLPGVRTIVIDGVTGYLSAPENEQALYENLEKILGDESLQKKIGEHARQRVLEHYSWKRHIEGLVAIYQGVLEKKN